MCTLCGSKWTKQAFWLREVFGVEVKKPVLRKSENVNYSLCHAKTGRLHKLS